MRVSVTEFETAACDRLRKEWFHANDKGAAKPICKKWADIVFSQPENSSFGAIAHVHSKSSD